MVGMQEPIARLDQTPKRLLIAGASARTAAWSASQVGFEIAAIDLFGDQDLRAVADSVQIIPSADYPSGIRDLVRHAGPADAWLYTGGLENYPQLVEQISEQVFLVGNGPAVLNLVRDPKWLEETFQVAHIPFPQTIRAPQTTQANSNGENLSKGLSADKRWLRKPLRSAAGAQIQFADPLHSPCVPNTYFQEFLDGPTYSAVYLAPPIEKTQPTNKTQSTKKTQPDSVAAAQLIGITRLWTAHDLATDETHDRGAFRYLGSSGPVSLSDELQRQWQRIGDCLVAKANLRGLFGVDAVVVNSNGDHPTVYPIEVNPRYTVSTEILERAMRCSLVSAHVNAFAQIKDAQVKDAQINHSVEIGTIPVRYNSYWGKRIRFAETTVSVEGGFEEIFPRPKSTKSWILADIPHYDGVNHNGLDANHIKVGDPILTTIAESNSLDNVEQALGFRPPSDT